MAQREILITTTENIPGKKYELIGEVFGPVSYTHLTLPTKA